MEFSIVWVQIPIKKDPYTSSEIRSRENIEANTVQTMPYMTIEEAMFCQKLYKTRKELQESGFYYGNFSHGQSMELLKK